jgi:DNA-binding LacI/PurR family transcriptional regulator
MFWDVERAAELATGFLLEAIATGGRGETLREVIAPELVVRASTG